MLNRLIDNVIAAAVLLALAYAFPRFAVWFAILLVLYLAFRWYQESSWVALGRAKRRATDIYQAAKHLSKSRAIPDADAFQQMVWTRYTELLADTYPALTLTAGFLPAIKSLYDTEDLATVPPPPEAGTVLEYARYTDRMAEYIRKLSTPGLADLAADTVAQAFANFTHQLPPMALQTKDALLRAAEAGYSDTDFSIRLLDTLPNVGTAVQAFAAPFFSGRAVSSKPFDAFRDQMDRNARTMSGVPLGAETGKLIGPQEHRGTAEEVAGGYLGHTPFLDLLLRDIPFELPDAARFEHHWIVAGSGHGKTQTLQYLIAKDLERVAKGGASVVVIDSQGDLIKAISGLKIFARGEPLDGKLCLIDPTDIEYPVALNLFDVGMERISTYKPLDRERLTNGVLELYDFVLSSLLSAELTQKQTVIFRYITRLMLHIPGATTHTFRELMEPKGYEKYKAHIDKLDGTARAFFETEFNSKQFEDTKRQVVRRLWGILENRTFERMFTHPKNKLDLFSEMNTGKVIVINTAKELLKQTGTEIFGRFFIALIAQAAQERATIDRAKRMPTFVYIDECADYLDQNVSLILEQARKFNVGMVLAHQYVGQLSPKLQESFSANTSIKFAGGASDKDARQLAHMLRCAPEFVFDQPKGHFAASVRGLTASAVSLQVPFGHMEAMPRMTESEFESVRGAMRERYAVPFEEAGRVDPVAPMPGPVVAGKPEEISTEPSTEW